MGLVALVVLELMTWDDLVHEGESGELSFDLAVTVGGGLMAGLLRCACLK